MGISQCKNCKKTFNENDGKLVDHVLVKHGIQFFKWSKKKGKLFKVANKKDRDELVSDFFTVTEIGDN